MLLIPLDDNGFSSGFHEEALMINISITIEQDFVLQRNFNKYCRLWFFHIQKHIVMKPIR